MNVLLFPALTSLTLTATEQFNRGAEYYGAGKTLRAAVCLRKSLQLDASDQIVLDAFHETAETLLHENNLAAAEACWQKSLELDRSQVGVLERYAFTLRRAGRLPESANALYETIHADAAMDDEAKCWLWLDLGALLEDIAPIPGAGSAVSLLEPPIDAPIVHVGGEDLTAEECYDRAIALAPSVGAAHKRLADLLVQTEGPEAAHPSFERAASLLPSDICCATHTYYGSDNQRRHLPPLPLVAASASITTLSDLTLTPPPSDGNGLAAEWASTAAELFETHGAISLPSMLDSKQIETLRSAITSACEEGEAAFTEEEDEDGISFVWAEENAYEDEDDFSAETRAPEHRTHKALRIEGGVEKALGEVLATLWPLLSSLLQAEEHAPLIGAGFMVVRPGASAQELHKDVHGHDRFVSGATSGGGPRAISIQIQLTDTTSEGDDAMGGSLEILPGSHRPDAAAGSEAAIRSAMKGEGVLPVKVPGGSVTLYSSRLWHNGGANNHPERERIFAFLTVAEPETPAPPGLIHTMSKDDVGSWLVSQGGVVRRAG